MIGTANLGSEVETVLNSLCASTTTTLRCFHRRPPSTSKREQHTGLPLNVGVKVLMASSEDVAIS